MRGLIAAAVLALAATAAAAQTGPTPDGLLKASPAADWRAIDPADTLYMDLPQGRVVIELNPLVAPNHVANIKKLVREGFFDGLAVDRLQAGFVAQWGDGDADDDAKARSYGAASKALKAEFTAKGVPSEAFTPWPDRDPYAEQPGFVNDMPAGRDPKTGEVWLAGCPSIVGAGREAGADTGSGGELYAVIAQQARKLDRNLTHVGRVVQGYDILANLKPGTQAMGFYKTEDRTPILRVRVAADLPAAERLSLEELRSDSKTFAALADLKRYAKNDFYQVPPGAVELCNAPLTVRRAVR